MTKFFFLVFVITSCYPISMKTSLFLTVVFLTVLIIVTVLGAFTFEFYSICTDLVIGNTNSFFDMDIFLNGIFYSLPIASVFACLSMIFYLARHVSHTGISFLVYCVLGVLVWGLIIPFSVKAISFDDTSIELPQVDSDLSVGYFRPTNKNETLFLVKKSPAGDYSGVLMYDNANNDLVAEQFSLSHNSTRTEQYVFSTKTNDNEFSDSLVEQSVVMPIFVKLVKEKLVFIYKVFLELLNGTGIGFICYASLALANLTLLGLKRLCKWRLLNISIVLICFCLIQFLTISIYIPNNLDGMLSFFRQKNLMILTNKDYWRIAIPLIPSLFCTVIGVVNLFRRPDPNHEVIS